MAEVVLRKIIAFRLNDASLYFYEIKILRKTCFNHST